MKTQHAQTPWNYNAVLSMVEIGAKQISGPYYNQETAEANAAFIVKAVNSHYELVEACKEVALFMENPLAWIEANSEPNYANKTGVLLEQLKQAIAKAEGGA